jgi:xylose dehydrogenase (NAD/NADP)
MEQKIVNWGIISCVDIAEKRFIPGLLNAKNAKLYAISSRGKSAKLKRFQQEFHPVKSYESYEELLNDPEIDAVYNPLPNGLHAQWTIRAVEKKKHVLCEKPMGATEAEVREMQAASKKNGVLLMEAFAYRQSPLTYKAKNLVEEGSVGKLKFIEAHYSYYLKNGGDVRLSSELAGGATYDVGCYNLNLIRYIAGEEPVGVFATGKVGEKSGVDEESCIVLTFANGLSAVSFCSLGAYARSEYTIVGKEGIIHVPYEFNTAGETKIILKSGGKTKEIVIDCPNNYMLEAEQFSRAVLGEEKPLITFEESIGNAKVIDEALRQVLAKK